MASRGGGHGSSGLGGMDSRGGRNLAGSEGRTYTGRPRANWSMSPADRGLLLREGSMSRKVFGAALVAALVASSVDRAYAQPLTNRATYNTGFFYDNITYNYSV